MNPREIAPELGLGDTVLFLGFGNLGRQDDGLGIRLVQMLEEAQSLRLTMKRRADFEVNYQLNVEDALLISQYDTVFFVDATLASENEASFHIQKLEPSTEIAFSTHAMSPQTILAFCEQIYQKKPKAYLLTLPGYEWEIGEDLSSNAAQQLNPAFEFVSSWLFS